MCRMILLVTISFLFIFSCKDSSDAIQPKAVRGVLDLSSWDFNEDGPVELSGEWEFYWNKQLLPEYFGKISKDEQKNFIHVPGVWNGYSVDGKDLSGKGYATYRLTVLLGEHKDILAFKFPDMGTAVSVFVNGNKISSEGIAGKTGETTIPQYLPHTKSFNFDGNKLEIILHVSNFHHRLGGAWFPIQFGLAEQIQLRRTTALMRDFVLVGMFLFMGLYHMVMFLFRRRDKAVLYIAAGCFLIILRTLVTGEMFFYYLVPQIPWVLGIKLEYLSIYIAIPVFTMFLHMVFPVEFSKKVRNIIVYISIVFSLVVVLTTPGIFTYTVPLFNLFTLVFFAFGTYSLISAVLKKREGSIILLFGLVILFAVSINDILFNMFIVNTGYFISYGFLGFIFTQAVFLSKRFTMTFEVLEIQGRDLLKANSAYEKELSERKRAEEALKKSEDKYISIFNNTFDGIFQSTIEGKYLTANSAMARILGYNSSEELIGEATDIGKLYVDPSDRSKLLEKVTSVDFVRGFKTKGYRKDGSIIDLSISEHAVRDKEANILYLEGTLTDITETKQIERLKIEKESAEASNRTKSEFLANMSHEIRTPMNAILGFSDILSSQEEDSEKKEMLDIIKTAGRGLLALINDILDFSRIEAGKVDIDKINFSLASLINHMEHMFVAKAKEKKLSFNVLVDKSVSGIVIGDEHRINQILLNLLGNAFKFTEKGSITLTCGYSAQRAVISVSDSGIGISEEKLETVFSAFSQADSSTVRQYGGTGLGLAISRQLAELMGGNLTADSRPGKGSVFTLELPLSEFIEDFVELEELPPGVNGISIEMEKLSSPGVEVPYRILLAEDNRINQMLVKAMLKSMDLECDIAENGKIALDKLSMSHYDLLLLDIQMPVMDGLETLKHIKNDENLKNLYVIALTANAMSGDAEKYVQAGCNDYLSKPIDRKIFMGKIKNFCSGIKKE